MNMIALKRECSRPAGNPQHLSPFLPHIPLMRIVHWTCLFITMLVITCGCLQPAPQNTPPSTPVPIPPTTAAPNPDVQKQLNFTVAQAGSLLNITYNGGPDATELQSIDILITNQDGTQVERTFTNPVIGSIYPFTYRGNANAARVNIIGTFNDGYQQTVLLQTVR